MIAFILLLLLGYLFHKAHSERKAAEEAISKMQRMERLTANFKTAKSDLTTALQEARVSNPDEVITRLIAASDVRVERDRLKQHVDDLDAKLTALTELQKVLESAAESSKKKDVTKEKIIAALTLQEQLVKTVKDELKQEFKPGQEAQAIREIVKAAKNYNEAAKSGIDIDNIQKANKDLKGQVAFLQNRLNARGGRDYPPCWVDENGKVEFLFSIELRTDSIIVSPAWPTKRDVDARSLPGIDKLVGNEYPHQSFPTRIKDIFDWSNRQNPQCRHYVQIKSMIPDAVQSDRARLMVENYFYKVEARR